MEISSLKAAVGASGSLTVTEMDRRSNRGGGCDCGRPIDSYGKDLAAKGLKPGPSASGVYEHQTVPPLPPPLLQPTATATGNRIASQTRLFRPALSRWGSDDPALRHIADMVHDIDLRDAKYGREESSGFTALITGICLDNREDDARLQAGTVTLDALYRTFQQRNRK